MSGKLCKASGLFFGEAICLCAQRMLGFNLKPTDWRSQTPETVLLLKFSSAVETTAGYCKIQLKMQRLVPQNVKSNRPVAARWCSAAARFQLPGKRCFMMYLFSKKRSMQSSEVLPSSHFWLHLRRVFDVALLVFSGAPTTK